MNINIDIENLKHDELLEIYNKTKDFISFLNNEIETVEVEKKEK